MRNKKIFSFDEERDAEKIIKDGFPNSSIDYSKMYLIAKYFRHSFKYGAIRLEKEIIKFCKSQDKNFNPVVESEAIKRWVNSAMLYDLRKIDSINISQKEIDFLKTIELAKDRKLLFMTLILAKALKKRNTRHKQEVVKTSDNYYIHYNNFLDIIRLAKVKNTSEIDFAKILYKYKTNFTFYNAEKELIRVDYADIDTEHGILIDNLDKTFEYYELFFNNNTIKKINHCIRCDNPIVKSNNNQKYCTNCAKLIKAEKTKDRVAKWRDAHEQKEQETLV
jgi:hypothetical protein